MVAKVWTVAFSGIEVLPIEVQVQVTPGLPQFVIVGLPDKAVAESRERIRNALHAIGLMLPLQHITVNLAPADVQKGGSHYDLAVAVCLLGIMEVLPLQEINQYIIMGELALDGSIRGVTGVLPAAMAAFNRNLKFMCPYGSGAEAAWVKGLNVLAPKSLLGLVNHFKGVQTLTPPEPGILETSLPTKDLKDIKGQEMAKRALEIAAAGGHNMLMIGPPGAGKSMLASRLPGILPPLNPKEALELTMIYSVAGLLKEGKLLNQRPFRDPHHSASLPALVGGGIHAQPGEVSLAHTGVLFLDELPEFSRPGLESLRQPLESKRAVISRANAHVSYPADIQLIAAMNPCMCGYLDDPERACSRAPKCGEFYQSRISGPLMDRIDLHVHVRPVALLDLSKNKVGKSSHEVAERVHKARQIQGERYKDYSFLTNAHLEGELLSQVAPLTERAKDLLEEATLHHKFSARRYYRILKVARTIADLEGIETIQENHLAEALFFKGPS